MSKALKKRGGMFVGPTTVYALMQSVALVNDHTHNCATRATSERKRKAFKPPC